MFLERWKTTQRLDEKSLSQLEGIINAAIKGVSEENKVVIIQNLTLNIQINSAQGGGAKVEIINR